MIYGAVIQRNGNEEDVAVKTVKGALTMRSYRKLFTLVFYTTFTIKVGVNVINVINRNVISMKGSQTFKFYDVTVGLYGNLLWPMKFLNVSSMRSYCRQIIRR